MEIIGFNNLGIGYGIVDGKKVFVEKTSVGDVTENGFIIKKSKNRQKVLCPYYDECGGCNLLHLDEKSYYDFKSKLCKCENIIKIKDNARRRATFSFQNGKFGFIKRKSEEVIEIDNCIMLKNEINEFIQKLKILKAKTNITLFDNGIGILLYLEQKPNFALVDKFLKENDKIIILSYKIGNCETTLYLQKQKPIVKFNNITIEVDNNIFLQATNKGQNEIIKIVIDNLKYCKNVLDLYCGIGTYTFPLSDYTKVYSIDINKKMIEILKNNIKNRKITATDRDLINRPLLKNELSIYDGIIINPPRNGAEIQCKYIINSGIKKIVIVSCNPLTLWRDVEILKNNYKLEYTVGIDQFYGTNHLEIVCVLNKI